MKKVVALLLGLLLCFSACAEGFEIKFRDFDWYSKFEDVDPILVSASQKEYFKHSTYENTDIDSIEVAEWAYMHSDDRVEEAGTWAHYRSIPVAGYVADVGIYYMYPIVNGTVLRETDESEMYLAIYTIEEMADIPAVYNDLSEKLTALYGDGKPKSNGYIEGVYWEDAQGNAVWLILDEDEYSSEVRLAYAAGGHKQRLLELDEQLAIEKKEAENKARTDNSANYSGL